MPIRGANAHIAATAYHEAGHALAALREGYRVEFARISRLWPGAGRVRIAGRGIRKNPFMPSAGPGAARAAWEVSLQRRLAAIRINMAGPLAEARYLGQPLRTLGAVHDLIQCERIACTLAAFHEELWRKYTVLPSFCPFEKIATERKRVRRWLGHPGTWRSIVAIAEALIEQERLSGEEIVQLDLIARAPADQRVLPLSLVHRKDQAPAHQREASNIRRKGTTSGAGAGRRAGAASTSSPPSASVGVRRSPPASAIKPSSSSCASVL